MSWVVGGIFALVLIFLALCFVIAWCIDTWAQVVSNPFEFYKSL